MRRRLEWSTASALGAFEDLRSGLRLSAVSLFNDVEIAKLRYTGEPPDQPRGSR
jgi:hypothetical protein